MADIQRYLSLITSQHQGKPKFMAWLAAPLGILDDATTLANDFISHFDLDQAVGAQQDIIGEIVGVKRTVSFQPADGSSPVLEDDTYKLVLQAKVIQNQWDGTLPEIHNLWNSVFPNARLKIEDNQDMTMNARISLFTPIQKDLAANGYIIPKPQGVLLNIIPEFYFDDLAKVTDSIGHILVVPGTGQLWGSGAKWGQGHWYPPTSYAPPTLITKHQPDGATISESVIPIITSEPTKWGTRKWGQNSWF